MNQGYLKLPRQFFQEAVWQEKRIYSKAEALIDLIGMARIAPTTVYDQGKYVELQRGMLMTSYRFLEQRWQWSNTKVGNFLKFLSHQNIIRKENSAIGSIITIINSGAKKQQEFKNSKTEGSKTLSYTYTNPDGILRSIETPTDFLKLWNAVYTHYLEKPCNRNVLSPHNKERLHTLKKHYGIEDFLTALKGLFENSNFGWTKTDPSHFLEIEHFQNYHTAGVTGQKLFNTNQKTTQKI